MLQQLDILTRAVSEMEVETVGSVLPDDLCISNTPKPVILQKLDELFTFYRLYQNTALDIVLLNKEADGSVNLVLVGNYSRHFLPLHIRMLSPVDFDVSLIEDELLYSHLETDQNSRIEIGFFKDECRDFNPTSRYIRRHTECQLLLKDLEGLENCELDLNLLECWLDNATEVYESISPEQLQFRSCFFLYKYYNILWEFKELMEFESAIEDALEAYNEINALQLSVSEAGGASPVRDWLAEQRWLYEETVNLKRYRYLLAERKPLVKITAFCDLYINTKDLIRVISFLDLFEMHDHSLSDHQLS